jgi:tetratricopeptide (TPR) repeat protein
MYRALLLTGMLAGVACDRQTPAVGPPPTPRHANALEGEVLEAITGYIAAISARPPDAQGRRALGLLYLANGAPADAVAAFSQATVLDPTHAAAWSYLGQASHQAGDIEAALAALEAARELDPEHLSVWWRPGFWLLEEGRAGEALPLFRRAAEIERQRGTPAADGAAYRIGQARCLMDLDRPAEAIPILEELNTLINHPYAAYLLAQAYRRAGRGDEAARLRSATGGTPPSYPDPWMDAVSAAKRGLDGRMEHIENLIDIGQLRAANTALTEARARWPEDVNLLNRLAELHRRQGNAKAWIRVLGQATRLDPQHAESHHNLSIALQQGGDLQQALNEAHLAVAAKPDFSAGWLQIGRLRIMLSGIDKGSRDEDLEAIQAALDPLDRAFELGVEASPDHLLYGHLLFRGGRLDDAQRVLEQLITRPDADPRAWAILSEVWTARGDHRNALRTAIDGLNLFPGQRDLARITERYRRAVSGADGS